MTMISGGASQMTSMLQDRLSFGEISSKNNQVMNPAAAQADKTTAGPSFEDTLKATIGEVNETLRNSDQVAKDFAVGKAENLHDVMIAMEKADIALRTVTAVRGKIMEAYNEIMKMPV